jgi:putative FmdB family regulatory protein
MPIYAYKCESCGHRQDVLQKISDPALQQCPACSRPSFVKQVTAAGFQLKGSGWYVTDFRGGNAAADKADKGDKSEHTDQPVKADAKAAEAPAAPSAGAAGAAGAAAAAPAAAPAAPGKARPPATDAA